MMRKYAGPMLIGVMFAFTLAVYGMLPERIPIHWDIRGEVDGWAPRGAAFLGPVLSIGLWLILLVLPRLDPKRENYERFEDTYWLVATSILAFLAVVHVATLGVALGWPVDMPRVILASIGVLLIAMGNYMPRVRPNWWMGIRTPWTLENERVWRDTHRLGGKTFVGAGLLALVASFLPPERAFYVFMPGVALAALVPFVYSYVVWRREQRRV
jgi:uncharacterized membrane protein